MVESTNTTSQQPTINNMNNLEQSTNSIEIAFNNNPISTKAELTSNISNYIEDSTNETATIVGHSSMFDEWLTNDLVGYISEGDQEKYYFQSSEDSITSNDVSPALSSTMTTPTNFGFDTIGTPQDLVDSPL